MSHADNVPKGTLHGWDNIHDKAFAKRFDF